MFCSKTNTNHQFVKFPNHNVVGANDSCKITIFVFQNAIFLYFYIETRKKTLASHELRDAWGCRTRGQKDQRCRRECPIFIYLIFAHIKCTKYFHLTLVLEDAVFLFYLISKHPHVHEKLISDKPDTSENNKKFLSLIRTQIFGFLS